MPSLESFIIYYILSFFLVCVLNLFLWHYKKRKVPFWAMFLTLPALWQIYEGFKEETYSRTLPHDKICCSNCGEISDKSSEFCKRCGTRL